MFVVLLQPLTTVRSGSLVVVQWAMATPVSHKCAEGKKVHSDLCLCSHSLKLFLLEIDDVSVRSQADTTTSEPSDSVATGIILPPTFRFPIYNVPCSPPSTPKTG
jgi:hypothetical protein